MQKIGAFIMIGLLTAIMLPTGSSAAELQVLVPQQSAQISFQALDNNRILASVTDAEGNPIRGLATDDFVIGSGIRRATIQKVEPFEMNEEVPLNIVLVVDNSFSMLERQAVKPLLGALDDFFDTVRPIDNVQAVVFKKGDPIAVKNRGLHVERFKSSSPSALKSYFQQAYGEGLTGKTYLHEGILSGLDIIQKMPADEQKFLMIFSDGEDLNSDYETDEIEVEAFGIQNFNIYCVDYMPRLKPDKFLSAFSQDHGGRIWKAKSADEIKTIFEEFTSTLMYRYVLTYDLPNPLMLQPEELSLDILTTTSGDPITNRIFFQTGSSIIPNKFEQLSTPSQTGQFNGAELNSATDRYFNLLNITGQRLKQNPAARVQIYGSTSDAAAEQVNPELAQRRAQAVRDYLGHIWEIAPHRLALSTTTAKPESGAGQVPGARAEQQHAEIIYTADDLQQQVPDDFVSETNQIRQLKVTTHIFSGTGPKQWELSLFADDNKLYTLSGNGDIQPEYSIALQELGLGQLAAYGTLEARLQIREGQADVQEVSSDLCHIRLAKRELIHELALPPGGMLSIEPEDLKIEELTMIDSSPLLNYIFFESGQSEIPDRFIRLASRAETDSFDPRNLKGTMDKYYNVMNIIGKRLRDNADAGIRIVGCNSNRGEEQGRKDLSRSRAEAVKAYLHYVWGIESTRLTVQARNLPEVVSNNRVPQGREENQRVEIYSDDGGVLDTVKSTYVVAVSDTEHLRIVPEIVSSYDLARWQLKLIGDDQELESLQGGGDVAPVYSIALEDIGLLKMGRYQKVVAEMEIEDRQGQKFTTQDSSLVSFVKREERVAQKEGYKVMEKYALILFDFNRTEIKERNKLVVDRIINRIADLPTAQVRIVGHTDTIGKEAYNVSLSERRAKAAFRRMKATGLKENVDISHEGAGPFNPMYDNDLPEGRALNRTVTVTIEYEEK